MNKSAFEYFPYERFRVYTSHFNTEVLELVREEHVLYSPKEGIEDVTLDELRALDHALYVELGKANKRKVKYLTRVCVYDRNRGVLVAEGWSMCSKNDQPRRKLGAQKALGRAVHAAKMAGIL